MSFAAQTQLGTLNGLLFKSLQSLVFFIFIRFLNADERYEMVRVRCVYVPY